MSPASTTTAKASPSVEACVVTMTAMATVMGAVGPEIWKRVPPNTEAKKPTAITPYRPAAAPRPDATPKASDTGSATTAEVRPPKMSPRRVRRSYFRGPSFPASHTSSWTGYSGSAPERGQLRHVFFDFDGMRQRVRR